MKKLAILMVRDASNTLVKIVVNPAGLVKNFFDLVRQVENIIKISILQNKSDSKFDSKAVAKRAGISLSQYYRRLKTPGLWGKDELLKLFKFYNVGEDQVAGILELREDPVKIVGLYFDLLEQLEIIIQIAAARDKKLTAKSFWIKAGLSQSQFVRRQKDSSLWQEDELLKLFKYYKLDKNYE